jgi:hypothetical protein
VRAARKIGEAVFSQQPLQLRARGGFVGQLAIRAGHKQGNLAQVRPRLGRRGRSRGGADQRVVPGGSRQVVALFAVAVGAQQAQLVERGMPGLLLFQDLQRVQKTLERAALEDRLEPVELDDGLHVARNSLGQHLRKRGLGLGRILIPEVLGKGRLEGRCVLGKKEKLLQLVLGRVLRIGRDQGGGLLRVLLVLALGVQRFKAVELGGRALGRLRIVGQKSIERAARARGIAAPFQQHHGLHKVCMLGGARRIGRFGIALAQGGVGLGGFVPLLLFLARQPGEHQQVVVRRMPRLGLG